MAGSATAAPKKPTTTKASKTEYHVLRQVTGEAVGVLDVLAEGAEPDPDSRTPDRFEIVATQAAHSDKHAKRLYVEAELAAGRTVDAPLVAVPTRSWKATRPKVKQTPTISFEDA